MFGSVWKVSEGVWSWANKRYIRKNIRSWYSDISFSSGALYGIKRRMSWCVWMVSAGVRMVSGWCLRLSENVWIPNILATNYIRPWFSEIAFSSSSLLWVKTPIPGVVCMVSGGVWTVSGWCLRVSGICLDVIYVIWIEHSWIGVIIYSYCFFSQCP